MANNDLLVNTMNMPIFKQQNYGIDSMFQQLPQEVIPCEIAISRHEIPQESQKFCQLLGVTFITFYINFC
ncbi:MAG: hypothetical protein COA77_07110 [Thaumarchaeota archaeon]|nr:MAG: hypothetical protein COA77_07110 [Nitrososphaerota archaeon]